MKFQNCILINFVTDAWTDGRTYTHKHTHGQAKSNMPLQLFQSWGHKITVIFKEIITLVICFACFYNFVKYLNN